MTHKMTKKKDAIKQRTHRHKAVLRFFVDGTARNRVVDSSRDIDEQIDELWDELRAGDGKPAPKQRTKSLRELLDLWHEDLLTNASAKAAKTVYREVSRILNEAEINDLKKLTTAKVRTAINRLRITPRKPQRAATEYPFLSKSSKHAYSRAIKQFARWLTEERFLDSNPLRSWKLGTVKPHEERYPRDRLQSGELFKLIATARNSTRKIEGLDGSTRSWLYTLASLTGFRRRELAALQTDSFDFGRRTVNVPGQFTKNGDPATQPLHHRLAEDLQKWLADKTGPLFPGLATKRTRKLMMLDLAAAEIPYQTKRGVRCFHSLRNTYISSLFDNGAGIATVQRLARHSVPSLTAKYSKPANDEGDFVDSLPYPDRVHDRVQEPV
jgi:integrase